MKKQLSTFTIIVISIFGTCAVCTAGIVATTPESERGASAEPTSQVRPAADMAPKTSPVAQNADLEENKIRAQQARDPITVEDVKCLAGCDKAPMFQLQAPDGIHYFENQNLESAMELIEELRQRGDDA